MATAKIHYQRTEADANPACKVDRRFTFVLTRELDEVTCRACVKQAVLYWKDAPIEHLQKLV